MHGFVETIIPNINITLANSYRVYQVTIDTSGSKGCAPPSLSGKNINILVHIW